MVALRSRRLEALLGSALEGLTYQGVLGLVASQAPEAFDLDYKSALYGGSDRDKRDLATDVAALANTAGGLLVLGIEEDDQARASSAPGVDINDEQTSRIERVIASGVVPLPTFDVLSVEDPERAGTGFLLIAIPRSPLAPHAVLVNEGFRYPRRNGSNTRYLSEPEVADAYRTRFAGGIRQRSRAESVEEEAFERLDTNNALWLVVSLVPDLPGEYLLNRETQLAFQREIIHTDPSVIPYGTSWQRTSVGRRRMLADGRMSDGLLAQWLSCELHEDGAGAFAALVASPVRTGGVDPTANQHRFAVDDEMLVNAVMSGLRFLGINARDRAAAGGDVLVRAQLYPLDAPREVYLSQSRGFGGAGQQLGSQVITKPQQAAERVVPLDSIATEGPELVAATYLLATELFQMFGWPEVSQLTRQGSIRRRYWSQNWQASIRAWAEQHGVDVVEETLP